MSPVVHGKIDKNNKEFPWVVNLQFNNPLIEFYLVNSKGK
jgi:hypothetical protein